MALTPFSDPQVGAGVRNRQEALAVPRYVALQDEPVSIPAFGQATLQRVLREDADYRVLTLKIGAWLDETGRLPPSVVGGMTSPLPVPVAQAPHPFQGGVGQLLTQWLDAELFDSSQGISLGELPIACQQGLAGGATSMRRVRILARSALYKVVITNRLPYAMKLQGVLFGYAVLR